MSQLNLSPLNRLFRVLLIACLASWGAHAQDNSFAITLQNNAMWQANLTKQMINLGGAYTAGGAPTAASCMPPIDLQRGVDGHVPPELQGDPRYQEYLKPFVWTATAESILAKLERLTSRISGTPH